jgi:hypothetical protein
MSGAERARRLVSRLECRVPHVSNARRGALAPAPLIIFLIDHRLLLAAIVLLNPVPKDHCLVVLEGYFDGAGGPNRDRLTLATACGTSDQWNAFTLEWNAALARHKADFIHTTDAVSLQNDFHSDNGWSKDSVDALISECVGVIAKHLSVPGPLKSAPGLLRQIARPGLHVVTLTIPLEDYRKARKVLSTLPNSVAEICTSESLGFFFRWGSQIGAESYRLYFDQGEPFYGHVCDRKHNRKSKKAIAAMKDVVHLGEANMRLVPALQLADFVCLVYHAQRCCHAEMARTPAQPSLGQSLSRLQPFAETQDWSPREDCGLELSKEKILPIGTAPDR